MQRSRYPGAALAVVLVATALTAGCAATPQTFPVTSGPGATVAASPARTSPGPSAAAPASGRHGGRGGASGGSPAATGALPADWPADLPVPAGTITGSTGSAGRWTVLVLAGGSAAEVRQSAVALYTAAGFTPVSDSVLNKGHRQITLVVENLDHSATQTSLVIAVTTT